MRKLLMMLALTPLAATATPTTYVHMGDRVVLIYQIQAQEDPTQVDVQLQRDQLDAQGSMHITLSKGTGQRSDGDIAFTLDGADAGRYSAVPDANGIHLLTPAGAQYAREATPAAAQARLRDLENQGDFLAAYLRVGSLRRLMSNFREWSQQRVDAAQRLSAYYESLTTQYTLCRDGIRTHAQRIIDGLDRIPACAERESDETAQRAQVLDEAESMPSRYQAYVQRIDGPIKPAMADLKRTLHSALNGCDHFPGDALCTLAVESQAVADSEDPTQVWPHYNDYLSARAAAQSAVHEEVQTAREGDRRTHVLAAEINGLISGSQIRAQDVSLVPMQKSESP